MANSTYTKHAKTERKCPWVIVEASLWCFLNSESYSEAVLKAVNLGEDTDTTGAVTGGLAGIFYGFENIPQEWISELARKDDIEKLSGKLNHKYGVIK